MSLAFFWLFFLLLAVGTPVVFALLLAPGLGLVIDGREEFFSKLLSTFFSGMYSFPLMAVPFFILAGEVMNKGGVTLAIVEFAKSLVGHVRGGLAQVDIVSSMLFSGLSGSAVADASATGKMLIPAMERSGYSRAFAAAVTSASAVVGPIIPPSGIMIIYAYVVNVSVEGLLAAGFVPGFLIGFGLMGVAAVISRRRGYPVAGRKATWRERWTAFRETFWAMLTPVILLGGILGGVFTPTEAAAVAAGYALFISLFVLRTLEFADLPEVFRATAIQSGIILLLIGAAVVLGWMVTVSQLAQDVASFFLGLAGDVYLLLFLINVFLFVVGMILDAGPAIIILGPVLAPVFADLGIDPIHFAVIMCVNLTVGLITPPMGLVLFVASSISGEKIERIVVELLPFLAVEIAVIFLITYVPALPMALPWLLGYA